MAIIKKTLNVAKAVGKALTEPNTIENGGGLSSYLIPRRFNAAGVVVATGGIGAVGMLNEGFKGHNKAVMGRISYGNGPARMTGSFTSRAPQAMRNISGGNYEVFSDMAEEVVTGRNLGGKLETYGATPELISALYNMGGR